MESQALLPTGIARTGGILNSEPSISVDTRVNFRNLKIATSAGVGPGLINLRDHQTDIRGSVFLSNI